MLHFLDRVNPIYPLKHTEKTHWLSLNNNIQIMKIILVLSGQHQHIETMGYTNQVGCCKIRFTTFSIAEKLWIYCLLKKFWF